MSKQTIVHEPNRVLRRVAEEVASAEIRGPEIQRLLQDMRDTLAASPDGIGLAAPQIGVSLRVFLVSEEAHAIDAGTVSVEEVRPRWKHHVFINPVFSKRSRKKAEMPEGCLSVPGKYGTVTRCEKVYVMWLDESGKSHARGFSKFFARVLQHEMDHLNGMLIVDRAPRMIDVER